MRANPLTGHARIRMHRPRIPFEWSALARETRGPGGYAAVAEASRWAFELDGGNEIRLRVLHQNLTYGGVLCGLPRDDRARGMQVESAIEEASRLFEVDNDKVCVLPPRLLRSRVVRHEQGQRREADVDFLPPIRSIALFKSSVHRVDPDAAGSSAVVVWFQGMWGPPRDDHVLAELRRMNWARYAEDWHW